MIYWSRFCCICLNNGQKLEKLLTTQENNLSYHDKLMMLIPQMDIHEIKDIIYICEECKTCTDNLYKFYNKCLHNNKILRQYASQLHINKNKSDVLHRLNEVQTEDNSNSIVVEDLDIEIKFETVELPTNILNNEQQLNHESSSVYIKEEIESSDDYFNENNVMVNKIEVPEINTNREIKTEDKLYTEIDLGSCSINEISDDEINTEDNTQLEYTLNHTNTNVKNDVNSIITAGNSNNDINVNNSKNDSFCLEEDHFDEIRNSYNPKKFQCDICSKVFNRSCNLKDHSRVHTGERPYKCKICNKSYVQSSSLKTHNITHTGEKPHKCKICSKGFITKQKLNYHTIIHTGGKSYKCEICNKLYKYPESLKIHNRIHSGAMIECDKCNKTFSGPYRLKIHSKVHGTEKSFKCDVCNELFTRITHLRVHKKNHRNKIRKKFHKCEICNKTFKRSYNLLEHRRTHTGEKPYKCEICSKLFTRKSDINKHSRVHTSERPYKCDRCSKSFRHSGALRYHTKSHIDE